MKECIVHGKKNEYYRRNDNTAHCKDCMKEMEKRAGNNAPEENNANSRKNTQYGLQGNNSMALTNNLALDKEKILRIDEYALTFFGTVK
jgi:hypothetical protein